MLLDTDIVVDILRGYPPALTWLESLAEDETMGEVCVPGGSREIDAFRRYADMLIIFAALRDREEFAMFSESKMTKEGEAEDGMV